MIQLDLLTPSGPISLREEKERARLSYHELLLKMGRGGGLEEGQKGWRPEAATTGRKAEAISASVGRLWEDPDFAAAWQAAVSGDDEEQAAVSDLLSIPTDLVDRWSAAVSMVGLWLETTDQWTGEEYGQAISDREIRRRARRGVETPPRDMWTSAKFPRAGAMEEWVATAILEDELQTDKRLRVVEVTKSDAFDFVRRHHSALADPNPKGLFVTIGALRGNRLCAVAMVNTPGAGWNTEPLGTPGRKYREGSSREEEQVDVMNVAELTRVASDGTVRGASSMLVSRLLDMFDMGWFCRGDPDGPKLFVTYQLRTETGSTYKGLESKGLRPVAVTKGKSGGGARLGDGGLKGADKVRWEAGSAALPPAWEIIE